MSKEKVSFIYKINHAFTSHLLLKLISLGLAIILWLYVSGEINKFN